MKLNSLPHLTLLLVGSISVVSGHKCLNFDPMPDFEMEKFFGIWYGVKTTFECKRCLFYEFYTQKIENFEEYADKNAQFRYIFGELEANPKLPSEMTFTDSNYDYSNYKGNKPLFVVIDTDYESYAAVYMCTNGEEFKHYVTILSRSQTLDKEVVNDLMEYIVTVHDTPTELIPKNVDHEDCNYENPKENSNDQNVYNNDGKAYATIIYKR